jgi:dihydropteroate synthase
MLEEGADIIDIGACSSRPGSVPVGAEEEWRRLEPVLKAVRYSFPHTRISIDTYWSFVVEKAYCQIGDFIINDISAGEDDPRMLSVAGRLGLEYIAMHKRGTPETMQSMTDYEDVTEDVISYFQGFASKAYDAGIKSWIVDPGFGFAKTIAQNYQLLGALPEIKGALSAGPCMPPSKLLVGVSRKSMICRPLGISPDESLAATQAVHMAALLQGADILRVHDVKEAKYTVLLFNMLASAGKEDIECCRDLR